MSTDNLPTADSYWVVPDRLLAGEYPGAKDADAARRKLARFRDAGVTLFFDLTQPNEYGLRPYAPLLAEIFGPAHARHRRFPIPDMDTPDAAQMAAIQESLAHYLARGEVVYVHCFGGIGRTGTVIGCYLVEQGMAGAAALDRIAQWRQGTPDGGRRSPETDEQWRMVLQWQGNSMAG